jgi:hypothetical protein
MGNRYLEDVTAFEFIEEGQGMASEWPLMSSRLACLSLECQQWQDPGRYFTEAQWLLSPAESQARPAAQVKAAAAVRVA